MLKPRFGFLLLLAMATVAHYVTQPQSATALTEDTSLSAKAVLDTRAPASPPAKTYAGTCSAYLQEPPSPVRPEDEGQGEATRVLDAFRNANATSGSKGISLSGARFALALAPDPIHTNLGLFFDRKIVSVQQAAQDADYDFDSAWLPWRRNTSQNLNSLTDRQRAVNLDVRRESCPGVLLFRSHKESSDAAYANALVVFVIGEQPTGGINLKQWDNALFILAKLQAKPKPAAKAHTWAEPGESDHILRILGPTFSGSFPSLARKLKEIVTPSDNRNASLLHESVSKILILSGSTTSYSEVTEFRNTLNVVETSAANNRHITLAFGTFNENDELHISRFLEYLKHHNHHAGDVAILSEDETAYARDAGKYTDSPSDTPLDLKYPRDISVIRDAYQKQSVFDSALPKDRAVRTILRSQSAPANGEGLDSLPGYSEDISALDQEARLFALADHLRVHHIRYLILRSTNPLDLLFLTRFFHRAYPEGRIVTIGSDLLFRREIDTNDFRGMMSLSSYPLLPRATDWRGGVLDGKEQTHQVFTGNTSEGDYMAGSYLFQKNPVVSDPGDASGREVNSLSFDTEIPKKDGKLPTYGNPYWLYADGKVPGGEGPPTWLTTLGRDGYWPVAVLKGDVLDHPSSIVHLDTETGISTSLRIDVPMSANICIVLAFVLATYQLWGVSGLELFTSDDLFFVFTNNPLIPTQPYLRAVNSALALMPASELILPRVVLLRSHLPLRESFEVGLIFMLMCSTAFFLLKPPFVFVRPRRKRLHDLLPERQKARISAFLAYIVVTLLMIGFYAAPFASSNSLTELYPLVYRMEHVTDGVSPLLPVLLITLSFYLWTWQTMAGNLMVGQGCPILPYSVAEKKEDPVKVLTGTYAAASGVRLRIVMFRRRLNDLIKALYTKLLGLQGPQSDTMEAWRLLPLEQFRLGQRMGTTILQTANPFHLLSIAIITIVAATILIYYLCFNSISQTMSLEGIWYNRVIVRLLLLSSIITVVEAFHLFSTWVQLRRLLLALGRSRISQMITKLKPISTTSLWTVSTDVHRVQYRLFFQQHEALKRLVNLQDAGRSSCLLTASDRGQYIVEESRSNIRQGMARLWWSPFRMKPEDVPHEEQSIRSTFADAAAFIMKQLLWDEWEKTPRSLYAKESSAEEKTSSTTLTRHQLKIAAAEEFISAHYVAFIHNIMARMRTMTMAMALIFATICFALSSYTFSPRPYISAVLLVNFAIIGATVAYVYAGMDRNEILSSIADTTPGRLGAEFWIKLTGFLIGPVIGILATQYPSFFDAVLGWIQPSINAVK